MSPIAFSPYINKIAKCPLRKYFIFPALYMRLKMTFDYFQQLPVEHPVKLNRWIKQVNKLNEVNKCDER